MSRIALPVTVFTVLALSGTTAGAFERLSETTFNAQVVGKSLHYKRGGRLNFAGDGTITGRFPGGKASGSWYWDAGKVCSRISVGAKDYPKTCRFPETQGAEIRFVQDSGRIYGEAVIR